MVAAADLEGRLEVVVYVGCWQGLIEVREFASFHS